MDNVEQDQQPAVNGAIDSVNDADNEAAGAKTGARLFDRKAVFEMPPLLSGREKLCRLRFPTDEECCELSRRLVRIERFDGRENPEDEAAGQKATDKAHFELFEKLRKDEGGDEFTPAEAVRQIGRLTKARVHDSEREDNTFVITIAVAGAVVVHTLRLPTIEDIRLWVRNMRKPTSRRHYQEIRTYLEPSGELWDRLIARTEGYLDPATVPIVHKDKAIVELIAAQEEAMAEPDPEI